MDAEIAFVLSEFMDSTEFKSVLRKCRGLIKLIVSAYRNARSQPDKKCRLFIYRFKSWSLIKILTNFAFTDESATENLVCKVVLAEIAATLQMNPNERVAEVQYLYWEVKYGI